MTNYPLNCRSSTLFSQRANQNQAPAREPARQNSHSSHQQQDQQQDQQQAQQQAQQPAQQPAQQQAKNRAPQPTAELSENYDWMRLTVDLPGIANKDLTVTISHGVLTIDATRRTMDLNDFVCIKKQKVSRRYAIDTDVVNVENITATLKYGILTVKAPKKSKPQRVRVHVTEHEEDVTGSTVAVSVLPAQMNAS